MPQSALPPRLDLTRLDERALPSAVTATTTARPFEFVGVGTLTTQTAGTADGTAVTDTATAAVTARGTVEYASNTAGQSGTVTVQGAGTGKEAATDADAAGGVGDYAQTVQDEFGFEDLNGTVGTTDPLTGTSKWFTAGGGAGATAVGPQALAGTFDVATFKLHAGWASPADAAAPSSGGLDVTLRNATPTATDLAFGTTTATKAADGSLGLDFTVEMSGDLVTAPTRDTAVAHITATWEGGGKSEAVVLDVPVYWNTGSVAVNVADLDPPAWAETLTVKLDAAGKLTEGDEANNTWTVTLADLTAPVEEPPAQEPPAAPPPMSPPPPPVVETPAPTPTRPTSFSVSDDAVPVVQFRDASGQIIGSAPAFGGYSGPINLATGDVNGDGVADVAVAAGAGGGPRVRVIDGSNGHQLINVLAYDAAFQGGVSVAVADVNGDGKADVITGAGEGGGPHVKVFDGATGQVVQEFFAYDADFRGGVNVAAVDLDGDGKAEVLTTPGVGGGPVLKVFDSATGREREAVYAAPEDARDGLRLEAVVDPAGGMIVSAVPPDPESPLARFHSQLKAGGPLLDPVDAAAA